MILNFKLEKSILASIVDRVEFQKSKFNLNDEYGIKIFPVYPVRHCPVFANPEEQNIPFIGVI